MTTTFTYGEEEYTITYTGTHGGDGWVDPKWVDIDISLIEEISWSEHQGNQYAAYTVEEISQELYQYALLRCEEAYLEEYTCNHF